ncbi:hypothetical protein B0T25DRAFT_298288 [Lasiosphaeria hispida]|uniref:Protein kinase domain-containing protein n=1 Tax=Lasiosphaeria hispida TaxID=260671 RepID=A0AAJ0MBF8_9PEZI|nr:hypothetical protein B0T25DRAFT_298288 [Lasiosphaeria hispida]
MTSFFGKNWEESRPGSASGRETPELDPGRGNNDTTWDELEAPLSPPARPEASSAADDIESVDDFEMEHVEDFGRAIYFSSTQVPPSPEIPPPDDTQMESPTGNTWTGRLSSQLREALQQSEAKPESEFLPLDDLVSFVSAGSVYHELRVSTAPPEIMTDAELRHLATGVCEWMELPIASTSTPTSTEHADRDPVKPTSNNTTTTASFTSRRAIFAVLVLMEQALSIRKFVRAGLWDCHLPFRMGRREPEGDPYYVMYDNEGRRIPDACFDGWKTSEWEMFVAKQWQTLAPYFAFEMRKQGKTLHYNLDHPNVILPFVRDGAATKRPEQGGYAEVSQVQVHNAHHNQPVSNQPQAESGNGGEAAAAFFAVKTLRLRLAANRGGFDAERCYKQAFHKEVKALDRCFDKNHPYLIRLLLTYRHNECYHLVFRWADGNMEDYWQRHPELKSPERNGDFANWVASQCLGIAEGVKTIHHAEPRVSGRHYGRHGDLKPANILWFERGHPQNKESYRFGQFVISDFGLTQFHAEGSKDNVDAGSVGKTDTYRPPECDVHHIITPRYDIWTLGCIFLELCAWYLGGWKEVDDFSRRRCEEEEGGNHNYKVYGIPGDTFFLPPSRSRIEPSSHPGRRVAQLKVSVFREFKYLHSRPRTTSFLHDLLDLIQNDILRMRPRERAECSVIVDRLAAIKQKCEAEPDYSTVPRKRTGMRTPTELSTVSSSDPRNPLLSRHPPGHAANSGAASRPATPELQPGAVASPSSSKSSSPQRRKPRVRSFDVIRETSGLSEQPAVLGRADAPIPRPRNSSLASNSKEEGGDKAGRLSEGGDTHQESQTLALGGPPPVQEHQATSLPPPPPPTPRILTPSPAPVIPQQHQERETGQDTDAAEPLPQDGETKAPVLPSNPTSVVAQQVQERDDADEPPPSVVLDPSPSPAPSIPQLPEPDNGAAEPPPATAPLAEHSQEPAADQGDKEPALLPRGHLTRWLAKLPRPSCRGWLCGCC